MGAFLSSNKNGSFWFLVSYLQDKNVYVNDARLIPYTPGQPQTYVDRQPAYPMGTRFSFTINENIVGYALVMDGLGNFYVDIQVPHGAFQLLTKDPTGKVIRTDSFVATTYAMLLGVAAQSYDERRASIELIKADQWFLQVRSGRLYPNIGEFFDFPPPPGWAVAKYRDAILGGCGPGFINSFFFGGTRKGVLDTIKSITCQTPQIFRSRRGIRWIVRNRANTAPTNPAVRGFGVTSRFTMSHVFVPPHYRAVMTSRIYYNNAVRIVVGGALYSSPITEDSVIKYENVIKKTDSFIQNTNNGLFDVTGKNLHFSIETLGDPTSKIDYVVQFVGGSTTAAVVAARIRSVTGLLDSVYATADNHLRIGVYPDYGKVFRITVHDSAAIQDLGFTAEQYADVAPDQLANPNVQGTVSLTDGLTTFTQGIEFGVDPVTGEILWLPSTLINNNIPPKGTALQATYSWLMIREIEKMAGLAKATTDIIEYEWTV